MTTAAPVAHLLCGLNGAGKTTLAGIFEEPAESEGLRILRVSGP
mgnify:CR=1 FL=1